MDLLIASVKDVHRRPRRRPTCPHLLLLVSLHRGSAPMARVVCLLALGASGALAVPHAASHSVTSADVLADAKSAFGYALKNITTGYECGWTRGTYMIGLWDYYNATGDEAAGTYIKEWGESYKYELCAKGSEYSDVEYDESAGARRRLQGACEGDQPLGCKGVHNANNQLCGATYISEYMAGLVDKTALAPTEKIFQEEIDAMPSSNNFWSWVDAAFMSMNTWSRLGAATGEVKYYAKQWANFNAAMLQPANGDGGHKGTTFGFWNTTQHLFYRDDRYVHTEIYWGRGNGWAMGALVSAIEFGANDPHREDYVKIFKLQAAKLASIASPSDGCWRSSLLNATGYPTPEMTGTSSFVYGMAYGVNNGILEKATYGPVIAKAWKFMSSTALQPSGLYGYCQPVGGSPEHNINPTSTSDFCVGQFLLAATQVSKLAASGYDLSAV